MVTKRGTLILLLVTSLIVTGIVLAPTMAASAPTKIAPTKATPPHPFTIIDTPEGRLTDGCVAVFELVGSETTIDLRTHKPYKTAHGNLPEGMGEGDYQVSVRCPSGLEFPVGTFTVIAPTSEPTEPTIEPTSGPVTTPFMITDPQGRMAGASVIVFFRQGQGPDQGVQVLDASFSADGKTATGTVPPTLASTAYLVTVHVGTQNDPPVFNALAFNVTG